jgi:hypothetical protein
MTAAAHPRPDLPAIDTANAPRPRGHYSQARIAGDLIFTAGSFRSTRRPVRWSARATSRNRPAKSSARSLQSRPAGRPQARPWCELAKTDKEYDLGAQTGDLLCLDCGETWWSRSPVPPPTGTKADWRTQTAGLRPQTRASVSMAQSTSAARGRAAAANQTHPKPPGRSRTVAFAEHSDAVVTT